MAMFSPNKNISETRKIQMRMMYTTQIGFPAKWGNRLAKMRNFTKKKHFLIHVFLPNFYSWNFLIRESFGSVETQNTFYQHYLKLCPIKTLNDEIRWQFIFKYFQQIINFISIFLWKIIKINRIKVILRYFRPVKINNLEWNKNIEISLLDLNS